MELISTIINEAANWAVKHLTSIYAALSACFIAGLMELRERYPFLRSLTDALICGIFALSVSTLLEWLHLPNNSEVLLGAMLGFIGADRLSKITAALALRYPKRDGD
ncbi:MAG: phage holin family protein [Pantoea sp.]|nr:phage holin family protein [Pantoea sp.]